MKKAIIAIILLLIIIGAGIWEQVIIKDVFTDFKEQLYDIESHIEDIDYALVKTGETIEWWDGKRSAFESLNDHNEIKDIRLRLGELEGYLLSEDSDMARVQAHTLIAFCENVERLLGIRIAHIL